MTSTAQSEIGPTTPSKAEITRRANSIRNFANMAQERAHHDDIPRALYWLDRAESEANWRSESEGD